MKIATPIGRPMRSSAAIGGQRGGSMPGEQPEVGVARRPPQVQGECQRLHPQHDRRGQPEPVGAQRRNAAAAVHQQDAERHQQHESGDAQHHRRPGQATPSLR
jgi:hypothetical protein